MIYVPNHAPWPGENNTNEEFIKVNPFKSIPAIDDNGFCVRERSVAVGD